MAKKTSTAHSDCFLEINGIEGESTDDAHPNTIEIQTYQFGSVTTRGGGIGDGLEPIPSVHDMLITAYSSSASPLLFKASLQGRLFSNDDFNNPPIKLFCRIAGGDQEDYLIIGLDDVLISSFDHGNAHDPDDAPLDRFSLSFGRLTVGYAPQNADGTLGTPNKIQHDLRSSP